MLTLLIEIIAIKKVNAIKQNKKLIAVICLANLVSFLLPYAILLAPSAAGYTFEMSVNNLPIYTVGLGYLFITLLAEVPIIYIGLKNTVENRGKLILSIIAVNVVTTGMVAAIERIVCRGMW